MRLTKAQLGSLKWLSRQSEPMWGGVYERGGQGDTDIARLEALGLIKGVEHTHKIGKHDFGGGYVITDAGREVLKREGMSDE